MIKTGNDISGKSPEAYRTIGEVADMLGVAQHVLRFWESRFSQIKPVKRAGNRRYYRPEDIALIRRIRELLHDEGYSIRGAQKLLKDSGVKAVIGGVSAVSSVEVSLGAGVDISSGSAPKGDREALRAVLGELREIRDMLR